MPANSPVHPWGITGSTELCPGLSGLSWLNPVKWFNCILLIVMRFMGLLITLAATILNVVINPALFTAIFNNSALYTAWADVRDVLNVAFIMVLLFSAFCTVFQIDKYNYKKILLNLIIMALLVNFSWPIARFIIDAANVLMYYFVNTLGLSSTGTWATFTNNSMLSHIINPDGGVGNDTSLLLASVVFLFIFAATLLIIGILLLIRIIILAVLLIFSSIAFVGSIMPGLSTYAGKWWDKLFKQAFFGPIMIFMISIAMAMMSNMASVQSQFNAAASQAGTLSSIVGAMAFFAIPVVILWVGLGMAQSLGAIGASAARKFGFGVMNKVSGVNFAKSQYAAFSKARKSRKDDIESNRYGGTVGKWANRRQDKIMGVVSSSAQKRVTEAERKEVQELRKKWKDNGGASDDEVYAALNSRNSARRTAAALEMAEKNGFGNPDDADPTKAAAARERFKKAMEAVKNDPAYKNIFDDKAKEKHVRFIIETDIETEAKNSSRSVATVKTDVATMEKIYNDRLGKMSADALSKQKNILSSDDFHDFFMYKKEFGTPTEQDHQFLVEVAKKISNADRIDWKSSRGYTL
jgi:hypothetical protein